MNETKDFRLSPYCPSFVDIPFHKKKLEEKILLQCRTKNIYSKIKSRKSLYRDEFALIYHKKCAYCGALCGLLSMDLFEIDHFVNKASFSSPSDAGRIENLVWTCNSCNRGKGRITIPLNYQKILNPDDGSIAKVFVRDKDFYIRIRDIYQKDPFIVKFYEKLHLKHQMRRLDYIFLELQGLYQKSEGEIQQKLGNIMYILSEKRNNCTMTRELQDMK